MIVVKEGKIVAVGQKFLQSLNITLNELSEIVSLMELQISSITNEPLKIKNVSVEIEQIQTVSIENIQIFNTKIKEELPPLESIEPLKIEPEIKPEEQIEIPIAPSLEIEPQEFQLNEPETPKTIQEPIEEIQTPEPQIDLQKIDIQPEIPISETKPEEKSEIKPVEKEFISITFDDELAEIEKLLSLDAKEAQKQITQELQKAAEDLSIDFETLQELKDELFEMLKTEKEEFLKAVKEKDYDKIHKIAHKLKGAALNLRISSLSSVLKKIDELSKQKSDIHKIEHLTKEFYAFLEKLENQKPSINIPPEIKQLILQTIQNYLETQNEKKFKKDKKYIEKILHIKINSIEDLQQLIKDS
jgi:HPt (histidine-containing phosphotransfer) domain-containing protein